MKYLGVCLLLVLYNVVCVAQVADSITYPEAKVEAQHISESIGSNVSETDTLLYTILKSSGLMPSPHVLTVQEALPTSLFEARVRNTRRLFGTAFL